MGKQWVGVVLGVVVGACLAGGAIALIARTEPAGKASAKPRSDGPAGPKGVRLEAGTRVELQLLQPLNSGGAEAGQTATAAVTKDVLGTDGAVAIAVGTTTVVEVVGSHGAQVLSNAVKQPVRLDLALRPISIGGAQVELCAGGRDPGSPLVLVCNEVGEAPIGTRLTAYTVSDVALRR